MLELNGICCVYGRGIAVHDFSCVVAKGSITAWLGPNGAGKTSALMAVMGLVKVSSGSIIFDGEDVTALPTHQRVKRGLSVVPEGRQLFGDLTVEENLVVGGYSMPAAKSRSRLSDVYDLFPRLSARRNQLSQSLSGGEQQMVAIERGMMADPKLLLIDELSLGLMPKMVDVCIEALRMLQAAGIAMVVVEQNTARAIQIADRICVLASGRCVSSGSSDEIRDRTDIFDAYIGTRDS